MIEHGVSDLVDHPGGIDRRQAQPAILDRGQFRGATEVPGQPMSLWTLVSLPQPGLDDRSRGSEANGGDRQADCCFEVGEIVSVLDHPGQHEQLRARRFVVPGDRTEVGEDQLDTERVPGGCGPETGQSVDVEKCSRDPTSRCPLGDGMPIVDFPIPTVPVTNATRTLGV